MQLSYAHKSILLLGLSDYIDIGGIIFRVLGQGYDRHEPLPEGIRESSFRVIKDLLENGLIEAGMPAYRDEDFQVWNLSPQETINQIAAEWDKLDHIPVIGDIVWFRLTPRGQRVAMAIDQQED